MIEIRKGRATREAYGEAILELGKENKNIYVLDCDVGKSCKTIPFSEKYPEQYINLGIAEQNTAGVAAGLATCGKIPFVTTYAVFGSLRMLEMIRQEICYPHLNVKIACSHGGFTPANDGASHQCIEDLGVLRTIPNMTVVAPADFESALTLVKKAAIYDGPVYLRFTRDSVPSIYHKEDRLEIGKAVRLNDGDDVTIISTGDVLSYAVEASALLEKKGISVNLLDMHTIKPLDKEAVVDAIERTGRIVTVEDHNIINGLGSAVAEVIAEEGRGRLRRMGCRDKFGESAPYDHLLAKNGVTVESIAAEAEALIKG